MSDHSDPLAVLARLDEIESWHEPYAPVADSLCLHCAEIYPCDAIQLASAVRVLQEQNQALVDSLDKAGEWLGLA